MGTLVTSIKEARQGQMAATAKMTVAINDLLDTNGRLEAEVGRLTKRGAMQSANLMNARDRNAQLKERAAVLFDSLSHLSVAVHDWNDGSLSADGLLAVNKTVLGVINAREEAAG